ncbi:2-hydroxy-6-oxo-2,4-heptadienoate hydrolase [Rhodococcus sp. ACS1]|uniref:alpha/beta fold hydrolase n=1 Tax=Rhodococcus sp. ACS1 TaxID=2028570 RepID=UPI000BB147EA|nr:alpha/beta hydrolase [Rhodococcus sp. ACS1]PBC51877.1 2-hydroxy-6-oxo-2,4-heptadienoate hydrolase [Rhodococcus sp. ACS1]
MDEIGQTIDIDGIATNYHDVGSGPVVLLLHGSGPGVTAHANWRLAIPGLSKHFRVLAPDIVGFGHTVPPETVQYNLKSWVQHISGFLDALGVQRCSVVGNSFGGALALSLAATQSSRVERLVLMGSVGVPFDLTDGLDAAWGYEPSLAAMRELLPQFTYSSDVPSDDLVERRYLASMRPGVQDAYASMFPAPRQRWIEALCVSSEELAQVDCQVLLIHGRDDRIIPVTTSEQLAKRLPDARLQVFAECGHWVQIDKSVEFENVVRQFLLEESRESAQAS